MIVGVVRESYPGERRVALVPRAIAAVKKCGGQVLLESRAGDEAGFPDAEYVETGASIAPDRETVYASADVICAVRVFSANVQAGEDDLARYRGDQTIIGLAEPLSAGEPIERLAASGVRCFALELIPRITRAQAMDVLSSQAMVAGYKAVALAEYVLPKMFPMMMTAAGTIAPAKVFVIGAGVAGLQAIAASKRAGAVVQAFDVRPEVREQVESLGARFVQLDVAEAAGRGGYAREQTAEERRLQQQLMADTIAQSDVVITTAAVPGKRAPILVPADVVRRMHRGSVVVDMAAERGGNCELTKPNETVIENGVTILGPTNIAATVPTHASQLYAKNVTNFLSLILKEGRLEVNLQDEIVRGTLLTEGGEIVHKLAREVYGKMPLARETAAAEN